ncbi:PQ-loop repeat-containing protein [Phanerochaete sordida]|uniref:PQ-loop repeat-containing protein n=1 Tax=Phanerochaete sordida TaxID=48140 RepID=A0A9P3GN41_9APHY|nr:PQ-loop repeat-containing protein [Phanerochaete sordida]
MIYEDGGTASSILGWMSIACWIVVYSPQIIENYQLKSGEGLSVFFVLIWLAGDLANLFGALLANLLPTIIILGAYYTICDIVLLVQIYYYRWLKKSQELAPGTLIPEVDVPGHIPSEETPLISEHGTNETKKAEQSLATQCLIYGSALVFVLGTGVAAWAIDEYLHRGQSREQPVEIIEWRSQLLGWISAVLYLGARIPQIFKNFHTKCEGLSPAMFLFAIAGNATYVLSILALSLEPKHIMANAGWIAGSGLTVFLDVFVMLQFFYYKVTERSVPPESP